MVSVTAVPVKPIQHHDDPVRQPYNIANNLWIKTSFAIPNSVEHAYTDTTEETCYSFYHPMIGTPWYYNKEHINVYIHEFA